MKKSNGVPELIVIHERSKRQTVELCGHEHQGLRCGLMKDHIESHECLTLEGPARWLSSKAS
jgi:metal-responsive CopG/Arc/MetJ family transcriptional regulator